MYVLNLQAQLERMNNRRRRYSTSVEIESIESHSLGLHDVKVLDDKLHNNGIPFDENDSCTLPLYIHDDFETIIKTQDASHDSFSSTQLEIVEDMDSKTEIIAEHHPTHFEEAMSKNVECSCTNNEPISPEIVNTSQENRIQVISTAVSSSCGLIEVEVFDQVRSQNSVVAVTSEEDAKIVCEISPSLSVDNTMRSCSPDVTVYRSLDSMERLLNDSEDSFALIQKYY
jgi:hypothetical protein